MIDKTDCNSFTRLNLGVPRVHGEGLGYTLLLKGFLFNEMRTMM